MPKLARVAALCLLFGASSTVAGQTPRITGTVTYQDRIALSPTAVVEVRLDDVTRPAAQAQTIARVRIDAPSQVPIRFTLPYDPHLIDPAARYAVRATISDGGVNLFLSADTTPVLTQGHGARADLVLTRVPGAVAPKPAPPPVAPEPPAPPLPPNPLVNLPATFVGTLPCADCPGIRYQLNLFPDDSFFLRMTYLERPGAPLDDVGSWALSSDRRVLVLKGRSAQPEMFAASSPGVLRKLDMDGQPIDSRVPHELTRASTSRPVDVRLSLRGLYSYMADAAVFLECSTGQQWPVAAEAANADLERAYAAARLVPGSAVLVELEGRVAQRPRMEGAGTRTALVVEQVGRLLPRESCAPRFTSAPLDDTYWRLARLGDRDVPAAADPRREASLTLQAPMDGMPGSYAGSTGCSRTIGTYVLDNAAILLTAGGTLRACKDEAAAEAAFVAALKATRAYRITGRTLELMDASGKRLARFEARSAAGITRSETRR